MLDYGEEIARNLALGKEVLDRHGIAVLLSAVVLLGCQDAEERGNVGVGHAIELMPGFRSYEPVVSVVAGLRKQGLEASVEESGR